MMIDWTHWGLWALCFYAVYATLRWRWWRRMAITSNLSAWELARGYETMRNHARAYLRRARDERDGKEMYADMWLRAAAQRDGAVNQARNWAAKYHQLKEDTDDNR